MKSKLLKVLLAVLTGILFTSITFFRRDGAEIHTDQAFILRLCKNFKKTDSVGLDYIRKNYLLVNTIPSQKYYDANCYTDRRQLLTLLRILNKNQHAYKYIVLDVLLDKPSQDKAVDDSLFRYLDLLQEKKKILFSGIWNGKDNGFLYQVNEPVPASVGDVTYEQEDNKFFQYRLCLYETQVKSLPFQMYAKSNGLIAESNKLGIIKMADSTGKRSYSFNVFTPEMYFTGEDFDHIMTNNNDNELLNDKTTYCNLQSIVSNLENDDYTKEKFDSLSRLQEWLSVVPQQDKMILIGDFSNSNNDSHYTTEGRLKGSQIIINILYNLQQGNGKLVWGHILFLLIGFIVLSFFIYMPLHVPKLPTASRALSILIMLLDIVIIEHLSYILLILISIGSYLFYNHIVNVLTLTLYIFLITSVIKVLKK